MANAIEGTPSPSPAEPLSPLAVSWQKLMMWCFIITDGLLFAGFLGTYGFARLASAEWPDLSQIFHLWFISLMTFVLISSSATMASAVEAAAQEKRKAVFGTFF